MQKNEDTNAYRQVHVDGVSVEVLELPDRLEVFDMLWRHLGDFEKSNVALIVDDGSTLDVCLGLVGQLHQELALRVNKML